jgi:hypothetical protein
MAPAGEMLEHLVEVGDPGTGPQGWRGSDAWGAYR